MCFIAYINSAKFWTCSFTCMNRFRQHSIFRIRSNDINALYKNVLWLNFTVILQDIQYFCSIGSNPSIKQCNLCAKLHSEEFSSIETIRKPNLLNKSPQDNKTLHLWSFFSRKTMVFITLLFSLTLNLC